MWRYKLVRMSLDGWEAVAVITRTDGLGVLLKMAHEVASF